MDATSTVDGVREVRRSWVGTLGISPDAAFVVGCMVVAVLLRLVLMPRDAVINWDGIYYATSARRIVAGDLYGGVSAYWSPLYPLFVGVTSLLVGDLEQAGRLVSVIAGALLVIPSYLLIRDLYGRLPAYLGTVLVVVHPSLVQASGWVMTESLYVLILTTGILVGWRAARDGAPRAFLGTGVLLGAAYLTRPEAVGYLALLLVVTLAAAALRGELRSGRVVVRLSMLLLGFAVLALPYVALVHAKTGRWTISQKLLNNVATIPDGRSMRSLTADGRTTVMDATMGDVFRSGDDAALPAAPGGAGARPAAPASTPRRAAFASTALRQLAVQIREYLPVILPVPLALVGILGFLLASWTGARMVRDAYLVAFFVSTLIGYSLTIVSLRYSFVLIPMLLAWTGRGTALIGARLAGAAPRLAGARRPAARPLPFQLLLLLLLVAALAPRYRTVIAPEHVSRATPLAERRAGLWLRSHATPSTLVMASSATASFYAGARHLFVPEEEMATVLDYARRRGVDFLVFSEQRIEDTPRAFPADPDHPPPGLTVVYRDEEAPGHGVVVYRVAH